MNLERIEKYEQLARRRLVLKTEMQNIRTDAQVIASDVVDGSSCFYPFQRRRYIVTGIDIRSKKSVEKAVRKLEKEIAEITSELCEIDVAINAVEDPLVKTCMQLKFIKGQTWSKVSTEIYGAAAYGDTLRKRVQRYFAGLSKAVK